MTALSEHSAPDPRGRAIPHTINAIGDALTGEQRARFYGEVLAAEADLLPAVMNRWWKIAMLDRAPGAERSRANAAAGRNLLSVDDLAARLEGSAR
ncbi:hypothetical protein QMK19_40970 [Streptomyces sp. H10-C2]|uniref:hypothetical protein n=1 Tax=unclassified Streptomyces TaxID=2593676 RepID=UPI0024BBCEB1|nr:MULTISPECIES: hypothetical protein [unclassified Streptomyces]MDJ0347561.1 hypothetical protein [Streptomyces sp. PH10-H1]MDJ0375772.1 hypothetical protein [Streptomyces sp. H10-C2]